MRAVYESGETSVRYYQNQKATHTCIPKNPQMSFQLLLHIKTMCTYIYSYHYSHVQEEQKNYKSTCQTVGSPWPNTFSIDITFENFQENHVRKQIKPTRHHHVLFFCAKRPTDNSCIESYARRNNKNLCISKSLVFTQHL